MGNQSIPQAVLSEQIHRALKGRALKAAVFLTFQFDPGFFEEEILPVLFDQSFSHAPKIRLLQLEESLREVNHIAVYYDRAGLTADAQPAKLDYQRIGLTRSTGYFHPKNIFLLLEDIENRAARESLVIVTLSANLTRSGWWENVEAAHVEEVQAGKKYIFRDDLRDLISRIKQADKAGRKHPALNAIRSFLSRRIKKAGQKTRKGRWRPRFYVGRQSVPAFLKEFIRPDEYNLEIISPYFDDTDSAGVLDDMLRTLRPKATRLFLPEGKDGAALCRREFFGAVEQLGVKWGRLPAGPLRASSTEKGKQSHRFTHAKVYRFWNRAREIFFVGSVNLTRAAHQSGRGGNFETGILVETTPTARLMWWLETIDKAKPTEFRTEKSEDAGVDEAVGRLSLRFNWEDDKLDYFWERVRGSVPPRRAVVSVQGVFGFSIEPIVFNEWIELPDKMAQVVKQALKSTSLMEVSADDGAIFRILVQEEGMAHKPSILLSLSAEEILQYWSLLSPEQREAFVNVRAAELAAGTEIALPASKLSVGNTMFDRFAGIFHAFGRLEYHVDEALQANRENEAVYRLFGKKYDSLPSLIDKIVQDKEADRVNRYVTLLCARQLLQKLEKKHPDFKEQHQPQFRQLYRQLDTVEQIQAGFTFATEAERQKFFNWFESMFFMEIPVKGRQYD